ncbi:metal dependent phosphohydrolase [Pochonia chlamydosporia 170]|uniref:Metal dependent phosphohydrolase n=1 Tax=Pochonia chlamydosporia 170 TaxID=1380566 RepID=A0A179FB84_METCM|nr:metal dependent phosphohydrolase [Pochonia chlamydosporia 170]OAQ62722.1 metal dependent phosphohydrolase [Pochonia chlamydosporia 170]
MAVSLEDLPELGLTMIVSNIVDEALAFVKEHCNAMTFNHVVRTAYWASILVKKQIFSTASVDLEAVIMSCILHDMGWAETKSLLSKDNRFEVDGANIAAAFIRACQTDKISDGKTSWNQSRVQRCWDAIALHSTPSIARHAAAEVSLTCLAIMADFMGPALPNSLGGENLITMEEYRAVLRLYPRNGFTTEGLKHVMCGLCNTKPATTFDNFVGSFGLRFGTDGQGAGKKEFVRAWEENQAANLLLSGLAGLEQLDARP